MTAGGAVGAGLAAVARRPERPDDAAFREALFRETFGDTFAGLDGALRDLVLRQQFAGQTAGYRATYPAARFDIVEVDGAPVGRIVTELTSEALTIVDVALLTAVRRRGTGTLLMQAIFAEAAAAGVPVRLRVLATNAGALRLYRRLGFAEIARTEVDLIMERSVSAATPGEDAPRDRAAMPPVPDRLRLPLAFDAQAMAADVARLEAEDWIAHFVEQNYDGDWSVIPLRGKAGATHPVMMIYSDAACRDFADTPFLDACPAIRAALAAFRCPLQAVRLMRLGPGSIIKEHRDHDLAYEAGSVRIHVPIETNADVDFRLAGSRVAMAPGSAWYLRLSEPHGVANRGASARVHLVVDALVDGWVEALFAAAAAATA